VTIALEARTTRAAENTKVELVMCNPGYHFAVVFVREARQCKAGTYLSFFFSHFTSIVWAGSMAAMAVEMTSVFRWTGTFTS
jgi:hypothetical protein